MNELEDVDYFEKDDMEEETVKPEEKPAEDGNQEKGGESTTKINGDGENQLEENIKSSVDTLTKIRNAVKNKSKENEEPDFKLGRSRSNSLERNAIKIQITFGNAEGTGSDSGDSREEERVGKRRESEEFAEGEEIGQGDPEKKVKLS